MHAQQPQLSYSWMQSHSSLRFVWAPPVRLSLILRSSDEMTVLVGCAVLSVYLEIVKCDQFRVKVTLLICTFVVCAHNLGQWSVLYIMLMCKLFVFVCTRHHDLSYRQLLLSVLHYCVREQLVVCNLHRSRTLRLRSRIRRASRQTPGARHALSCFLYALLYANSRPKHNGTNWHDN